MVNISSFDLESIKKFFESKWTRNKAKVERYRTSYYFAQTFDDNISINIVEYARTNVCCNEKFLFIKFKCYNNRGL